jgi:hypothetical protein
MAGDYGEDVIYAEYRKLWADGATPVCLIYPASMAAQHTCHDHSAGVCRWWSR